MGFVQFEHWLKGFGGKPGASDEHTDGRKTDGDEEEFHKPDSPREGAHKERKTEKWRTDERNDGQVERPERVHMPQFIEQTIRTN